MVIIHLDTFCILIERSRAEEKRLTFVYSQFYVAFDAAANVV